MPTISGILQTPVDGTQEGKNLSIDPRQLARHADMADEGDTDHCAITNLDGLNDQQKLMGNLWGEKEATCWASRMIDIPS